MCKSKCLILLFLASLALAGCSSGDEYGQEEEVPTGPPIAFHECVTQARQIDTTGRHQWHDEMYDYIVERAGQYEEVAGKRMEYQKALLDLEGVRLEYLLQNAPERIVTDKGLALFRNLSWTKEDSAALAAIDPEFSAVEAHVTEMQKANREHPEAGVFAEYFNVTLAKSKSYAKVVEVWQANDKEVTALLKRCLPHDEAPAAE